MMEDPSFIQLGGALVDSCNRRSNTPARCYPGGLNLGLRLISTRPNGLHCLNLPQPEVLINNLTPLFTWSAHGNNSRAKLD